MRIFFLTSSKNASGGGRQAIYLASGMYDRGHEVHFFSPPTSMLRPLAPDLAWSDLPKQRKQWRALLERAMQDERPTIIHAFHNKAVKTLAWCGTVWKLFRKPIACVAHRGVIYPPTNILPYIAPGIRLFAVNSQACLKTLPLFWRKDAGRVVYNCVPAAKITPSRSAAEVRAELGVDADTTILGCVSNNAPVKGLEFLIRAFAEICRPGYLLCLVGARDDQWGQLCVDLGISDSVRLIARTEEVADYLQIFTLFVLPSLSESSPNTLLEAMSMGLPAVCSDVGGVPECISDRRYLVPPGDAQALATGIASALSDREALQKAARCNLAFSTQFGVENKLDIMEELYTDLLRPFMKT